MTAAIALMLFCAALGMASERLTWRHYALMGAAVALYILYAYRA